MAFVEQNQDAPQSVSFAITGLLEGCQPLMNFAFEHLRRRPCSASVTGWMETVVGTIVSLHRAGYAHGDLNHLNILVRSHCNGDEIQVYLTDFDACVGNIGIVPGEAQVLDLACLAASLYRVVPTRLLWKALARYFTSLSLSAEPRRRCLETLRVGYRSFLNYDLSYSVRMADILFKQAEEALEEMEPSR
jgi:serine/threonine protein kinase